MEYLFPAAASLSAPFLVGWNAAYLWMGTSESGKLTSSRPAGSCEAARYLPSRPIRSRPTEYLGPCLSSTERLADTKMGYLLGTVTGLAEEGATWALLPCSAEGGGTRNCRNWPSYSSRVKAGRATERSRVARRPGNKVFALRSGTGTGHCLLGSPGLGRSGLTLIPPPPALWHSGLKGFAVRRSVAASRGALKTPDVGSDALLARKATWRCCQVGRSAAGRYFSLPPGRSQPPKYLELIQGQENGPRTPGRDLLPW